MDDDPYKRQKRYQQSSKGRKAHAAAQARYRQKHGRTEEDIEKKRERWRRWKQRQKERSGEP